MLSLSLLLVLMLLFVCIFFFFFFFFLCVCVFDVIVFVDFIVVSPPFWKERAGVYAFRAFVCLSCVRYWCCLSFIITLKTAVLSKPHNIQVLICSIDSCISYMDYLSRQKRQ